MIITSIDAVSHFERESDTSPIPIQTLQRQVGYKKHEMPLLFCVNKVRLKQTNLLNLSLENDVFRVYVHFSETKFG